MGIINSWRQIGRCRFWPHLLLGVVAAFLGISSNLEKPFIQRIVSSTLSSVNHLVDNNLTSRLVPEIWQVRNSPVYAGQTVNAWQQQVIRRLIKQLRLSLADEISANNIPSAKPTSTNSLQYYCWVLTRHLTILLSNSAEPVSQASCSPQWSECSTLKVGVWLADTGGIRAGPLFLS